jgi:hypothetical protein
LGVAEYGWKKGFHGNAPEYENWVGKKVNDYVEKNGVEGLQNYLETKLIPEANKLMDTMYEKYKKTGKTLNDQFKELNVVIVK